MVSPAPNWKALNLELDSRHSHQSRAKSEAIISACMRLKILALRGHESAEPPAPAAPNRMSY
jgi:hypothetical protein